MEPFKFSVTRVVDYGLLVSFVGTDRLTGKAVAVHVDHRPGENFIDAWVAAGFQTPTEYEAAGLVLDVGVSNETLLAGEPDLVGDYSADGREPAEPVGAGSTNGGSKATIRSLNDELRRHGRGGQLMISQGLEARGESFVLQAMAAMADFDAFDESNDPHQEHDCASLRVLGEQLLFKIDYYDPDLAGHSADPADGSVTRRVLTLMLAEEY